MRILFVTTEFPWPCHGGGRQRTLSQLRTLASLPEVTHLTVLGMADTPQDTRALREVIAAGTACEVTVPPAIRHPIHLWNSLSHVPRVLWLRVRRQLPYLVAKWDCRALHREVRVLSDACDVVYFDHLGATAYRGDIGDRRAVLDIHNVESEIMQRFADRQHGPARWIVEREASATRRYEAQAMRAIACVVAISERDAKTCAALSSTPVQHVPMAVVAQARRAEVVGETLCYLGSLSWHPNVAGLDWFCAKVWPSVRAARPNATLEIAGVDGDARRWRAPGIRLSGFCADPRSLYDRSRVFIAPAFGGAGISVKVLNALAAGIAVVTTPDGAKGLAVADGRELLIREHATGFASAVVRLLSEPALATALTAAAQAFVEQYHSRARTTAALRHALVSGTQVASHQPHQRQ